MHFFVTVLYVYYEVWGKAITLLGEQLLPLFPRLWPWLTRRLLAENGRAFWVLNFRSDHINQLRSCTPDQILDLGQPRPSTRVNQVNASDKFTNSTLVCNFYARELYRQVLLRARISYGDSVCPSVTTRYGFKARWDRDSGSSPYDSLESVVSYKAIWCHWVRRFPSNEGIRGVPP